MKIIYKEGTRKTLAESTGEVRSAVATALELVEGKHGFRTPFEIWRNCKLVITIGHNIYTTFIEIRPPAMAYGEFYQFNLSSCIRQQNSLTAQFVSFSLSNLANIFYPPPIFTIINLCLL